jgi:hypothetical protein
MADKPGEVDGIVMSVPHNATRTLQTHLSETRPELIPPHRTEIGHWHFTLHPLYCERFFELDCGLAYIPVRNPYNVIDSWNRRYGKAVDKQTDNCIAPAIELMVRCIDENPDRVSVFKMENLPVIRGVGPRPEGWDKAKTLKSRRMCDFRDWLHATPSVEAFYRQMYTADELWWL